MSATMNKQKPRKKGTIVLRLFVAGDTLKSRLTIANLKDLCQNDLKGQCDVEVIDLTQHPEMAIDNNISALPALVKELPLPVRTLIGDLASRSKVLIALDIKDIKEGAGHLTKANKATDIDAEYQKLLLENERLKSENSSLRRMLRKNND